MHDNAFTPAAGCVVEFMQGNQAQVAWVQEVDAHRLRCLTQHGKLVKLVTNRLLPWSGPCHDPDLDREAVEKLLNQHAHKRAELAATVDPLKLWSLAQNVKDQASVAWFAKRVFDAPDTDQLAAVGRALIACKTHFKLQPPDFAVHPPEVVELKLQELDAARQREELVATGRTFFHALWPAADGRLPEPPSEDTAAKLADILRAVIRDPEDRDIEPLWREIRRGLPETPHLALLLAQKWGLLPPHYNFHLDRAGYRWGDHWAADFADAVHALTQAAQTCDAPLDERPFVSIDAETTQDIDDAFFVTATDDGGMDLAIALACPVLGFDFESPFGKCVLHRASSLYLPEGVSHMLPVALAEGVFSLKTDRARPSLVLDFHLPASGEPVLTSMRLARVKPAANLSFNTAEAHITAGQEPFWKLAKELAAKLRSRRLDKGAVIIERQEPDVELSGDPADQGDPLVIIKSKDDTPVSWALIMELMILANEFAAAKAVERGLPLLFRTQDTVLPKSAAGVWTTPDDIYRAVRELGATMLETNPRPHRGIGAQAYASVTSPIRRIVDFINVAQLLALATDSPPPFDQEALDGLLPHVSSRLDAVSQVQRFRPRYWKLAFLKQQRKDRAFTGVAVDESGNLVTLALPELQIFVRAPRNMLSDKIYPGQKFGLRFGRVDPLTNEARVAEAWEEYDSFFDDDEE